MFKIDCVFRVITIYYFGVDCKGESKGVALRFCRDFFEPSGPPVTAIRDVLRCSGCCCFLFWWFGHVIRSRNNRLWIKIVRSFKFGKLNLMSPSGHSVMSIPIRVLYSHAGPVGTAEDLSSQTTKLKYHVIHQVIQITCKVTWWDRGFQVTW